MSPLAVALGFAPVVLLLVGLVTMDCYKLVARRAVALSVGVGALAAVTAWGVNRLALDALAVSPALLRHWIAPVVEEALKLAWIGWMIRRGRIGFLVDAGIHGFAIGTGFAVAENVYYARAVGETGALFWLVRGLGTAIMHGGATAIAAIMVRDLVERRANTLRAFAPGFGVAVVLHAMFNQLPFSPLVATACIILIVPLVLIVAYERSEAQTRDWLGTSMEREVELMDLIRSGAIADTHVGRYLSQLRERFPGPVVADMLCLLEIHATLSMLAKGMMLARAAGVDLPPDPQAGAHFRELRYLEGAIGPTGRLAIKPFLRRSSRDRLQLRLLEASVRGRATARSDRAST